MYGKVPFSQCLEKTGKPPIGTRWVDINRGIMATLNSGPELWDKKLRSIAVTTYLPQLLQLRQWN